MNMTHIELQEQAIMVARKYFLRDDNRYGCAESTYITLKTIFELPSPEDSSPAMALNGGIAYSGGMCGAITGTALAVGELAGYLLADHRDAKKLARTTIQKLLEEFRKQFSSDQCRDLIPYQIWIPAEHEKFIESGIWKTTCMRQIEFVVARVILLKDENVWLGLDIMPQHKI